MADYSREQLYEAMRRADAAGDAEAVKAIAAQLKPPAPADEDGLNVRVTYEGPNLADGVQNAAAGAVQGALGVYDFPMEASKGLQGAITSGLGAVGGALLDTAGMGGAADWWRDAATARSADLSNSPSLADMVERASPTPEGMGGPRFLAQLMGGAAVPFAPKSPARVTAPVPSTRSAAQGIVQTGKDAGVRVMTSDVKSPKTFIGNVARATGERIPIAGTGAPRAAQQGERIQAVKDLARDFGADVGMEYMAEVSEDLAKTRGAKISSLTAIKNRVIDGIQGAVDTPRAVAAIDQQIAKLRATMNESVEPVIAKLTSFRNTITSGLSLRNIEENRRILGEAFEDPSLAAIKSIGQKAVNAIYAPLRDDMGAFIKQTGGNGAFQTWRKANGELAELAGELSVNSFKRVLSSAETTPENVATILLSRKPSEVRRLMANLSPDGRTKAQAAIIDHAIGKAGGLDNLSPDRFANEIGRIGKQVGVVFEGQDLARVQGLERLLQATKRAGQASAAPPTGVQNAPIIGGFAAGSMFDLGTSLALFGGAGGLARLYESAAVRNMLVGLSKTQPGSKAEGAMLERIGKVAISQLEIRAAANDTVATSLAAGQTEEQ